MTKTKTASQKDLELFMGWQQSPIAFIKFTWNLVPQPLKIEYLERMDDNTPLEAFKADWFEPFQKDKHITWQQWVVLVSVERAIKGEGIGRISIASGHGIGKSCTMAWLVLWYLFCFKDSQVPCTAPTSDQIYDILWKEIAKWLKRMPEGMQSKYDWTNAYVRINESPETWFARAKTAKKEQPEALAGVHGDYVFYVVDEASGVPEEIFTTAEGALTGGNVLMIMISNPTRLIGYFYDSHHEDDASWQNLQFSSKDSPIVDEAYTDRIISKYGLESNEYRIRVLGLFPKAEGLDDKGYVPLLAETDLQFVAESPFIGRKRLGVDPAGGGKNLSTWIVRDNFKAQVVASEAISTPKGIAQKTLTLMRELRIDPQDVYVDEFGVGAKVVQELSLAPVPGKPKERIRVNSVNVGDTRIRDKERFMNLRMKAYWDVRSWIKQGGCLVTNDAWRGEALSIRYRATLSNRMQCMPKREMKKAGYKSPDHMDGLMLTFTKPEEPLGDTIQETNAATPHYSGISDMEDRYNLL